MPDTINRPWEELSDLLVQDRSEPIRKFVENLNNEEVIMTMSHLSKDEQQQLMRLISPEEAAEILEEIPDSQATAIIEEMPVSEAAAVVNELPSAEQADLLTDLDEQDAQAIISEMDPEEAQDVQKLISYDAESAGGLMITEFLQFPETMGVGEVTDALRKGVDTYRKYSVQYVYVHDAQRLFRGVVQMRDLLLSEKEKTLGDIVIPNTLTVNDTASLDELSQFFDEYDFYGVPVLDEQGYQVGVVLRKHIQEAETEKASIELLETQGIVGGEELRTMPILRRSGRRLSWLSVNIGLNLVAASVIALYQDTLSAVIALAVFLPIISDMSGCSGNQSVAVSLRELSLGVVKPFEVARVWIQEISVGLINGVVLGLLIGLAAFAWKGNIFLGMVVGGALAVNTVVAVSIGGTVPLLLRRFGIDPALASGPILTTITDMFGFFLTLALASMALGYLT